MPQTVKQLPFDSGLTWKQNKQQIDNRPVLTHLFSPRRGPASNNIPDHVFIDSEKANDAASNCDCSNIAQDILWYDLI